MLLNYKSFPVKRTDLEIGAKVSSDVRRVTLRQNGDFLLDVFNFIICCLQINDLDCYHATTSLVNAKMGGGGERGERGEREKEGGENEGERKRGRVIVKEGENLKEKVHSNSDKRMMAKYVQSIHMCIYIIL